jgi:hypothetical protein
MHFIWYNPEAQTYKYGNQIDFNTDIESSDNPRAYTVLMEFDGAVNNIADKIIQQLNIANSQVNIKLAS